MTNGFQLNHKGLTFVVQYDTEERKYVATYRGFSASASTQDRAIAHLYSLIQDTFQGEDGEDEETN